MARCWDELLKPHFLQKLKSGQTGPWLLIAWFLKLEFNDAYYYYYYYSGQGICKSNESNSLLFECYPQHKCEQDLQVHHSKDLQPAIYREEELNHRRAYYRFLGPKFLFSYRLLSLLVP